MVSPLIATGHRAIITSMQLTDEQRDAIIAWAERTPQVQSVMLFGSRCKGTARPDSDVDLALAMTKGRWKRRFENCGIGAMEDRNYADGVTNSNLTVGAA